MNNLNLKKIPLTFDPALHRYELSGKWLPGVTTVIGVLAKPFLLPWAVKLTCEKIKELWKAEKKFTKEDIAQHIQTAKSAHTIKTSVAAGTGTDVHQWISDHLGGKDPMIPEDKETANSVNQYLEWQKQQKIEWLGNEIIMASEKYQYAGCADGVAVLNGKLCVVDFKSSNAIYPVEMNLQLCGYQIALEEMGCPPIEERYILRFPKEGSGFEVWKAPDDYEAGKRAFLAALELYHYVKKNEKKYEN